MDRRGPDVLCVSLCALDVGAERGAKAFGVGLQAGPGPRLDIHTSSYPRTHTQSGPLSVPITACTEDHGHACLFLISLYLYLCSYSIENRLTFCFVFSVFNEIDYLWHMFDYLSRDTDLFYSHSFSIFHFQQLFIHIIFSKSWNRKNLCQKRRKRNCKYNFLDVGIMIDNNYRWLSSIILIAEREREKERKGEKEKGYIL